MKELACQVISLVAQLAPVVIPPIAVYLGWKLGNQSERRRRVSELLEKRFDAFRQLKAVTDSIQRGDTVEQLAGRFATEPELLSALKHRLVRVFGLRRELVPYLDHKIALYIDQELYPLFHAETGTYELKPGVEHRFAQCCVELVGEIDRLEKDLVAQHRKTDK